MRRRDADVAHDETTAEDTADASSIPPTAEASGERSEAEALAERVRFCSCTSFRNKERVVPRDELLSRVWTIASISTSTARTVDTHVTRCAASCRRPSGTDAAVIRGRGQDSGTGIWAEASNAA